VARDRPRRAAGKCRLAGFGKLLSNTPVVGVSILVPPNLRILLDAISSDPAVGRAPPTTALLAEITAGLSSGRDLRDLLQRFLEPLVRLAGAQGGAVRVLSDGGEHLELVSQTGLSSEMSKAERSMDRHCGFCGAAADGSRVVWAADLSPCQTRSGNALKAEAQVQRMLAVPLQHRGRVLGVYNLFFAGCGEPSAEVLALLKSVGELLGLALDNVRLEAENLRATLLQERQMMAAEVHDSVAQSLAFVKMRLPLLRDAVGGSDKAQALRYCDEVRSAVSEAHSSLRGVLAQLRSPMDPLGLVHALDVSTQAFRRHAGAELDFVNELPNLKLDPGDEAQVFHIVQEALNNVARHAQARQVRLRIAPGRGDEVEVVVEDDGAGLPAGPAGGGSHYGLEIMRERARRIGGTLEIGPRDGGGTRVELRFALRPSGSPLLAGAV
jgi:two-component system, NarL family, nitrate/nitrite sensor histidine kinase NarX